MGNGDFLQGKGERGKGKGMEIKSYLNNSLDIFFPFSPFPLSLYPKLKKPNYQLPITN
jgi:hypothetical protein